MRPNPAAAVAAAKRPCIDHHSNNNISYRPTSPDTPDTLPHHQHHHPSPTSPPPPKRPCFRTTINHDRLLLKPTLKQQRLPHPCPAVGGVEPELWLANYLRATPPADTLYLADPPSDTVCAHHRETVVLWLLQARHSLGVARSTMYVAVSIMDAYLANSAPLRLHLLQLLAAACVFIAVKTSEQQAVSVARLVDIAAGAFDAQALIDMETIVLNRLSFRVAVQTSFSALPYIADIVAPFDRRVVATATFAADIALAHHRCACIPPAIIALAAVSLACSIVVGERDNSLNGIVVDETVLNQVDEATIRIIDAWRMAVMLHDSGKGHFLVRDAPLVAARLFPRVVRFRVERELGVFVEVGNGAFAKWAAGHLIEDLLPELY